MSEKPMGWWRTTTSGVVAALVTGLVLSAPSIVKWWSPAPAEFFADGSGPRWVRLGWRWLTVDWTLPAVPMLFAVAALAWAYFRASFRFEDLRTKYRTLLQERVDLLSRATTKPRASAVGAPTFTHAEAGLIRLLLHAGAAWSSSKELAARSDSPPIALDLAAEGLAKRGLIERSDTLPFSYQFTPLGKTTAADLWNASKIDWLPLRPPSSRVS